MSSANQNVWRDDLFASPDVEPPPRRRQRLPAPAWEQPELLLDDLNVAAAVLQAIMLDMLLTDDVWQAELGGRVLGCEAALDAIAAHHAHSDRERSLAYAIGSQVSRCRDGLHMIRMGLPRQRQDMILRGGKTVFEAAADIRMASDILRR